MSYSHTKRRKNIKRLKKQHGNKWRNHFVMIGEEVRAKQEGPCLGSIADLIGG